MTTEQSNKIELAPGVMIAKSALRFRFARSAGPGGQNVNKLNTKATLTVRFDDLSEVLSRSVLGRLERLAGKHLVDDRLIFTAGSSRSQLANRRACLAKLRDLIVQAKRRPRVRKATKPTRAAREKRLQQKTQRGQPKRPRRGPSQIDDA